MHHGSDSTTGRRRRTGARGRRGREAGLAGVQPLEPRHALTATPSLVGDINIQPVGSLADFEGTSPGGGGAYYYSAIKAPEFVSFAGRTVFVADDGIHGTEPWVSDGTPGGTSLLKDLNPSFNDLAFGGVGSEPSDFFVAGDTLYFSAYDPVHGRELWKTDGTPAGTVLVKDIGQGPGTAPYPQLSSYPHGFTRLADGTVFFVARDAAFETIWKTDGTEAGTVRLDQGWATPLGSGYPIESLASLGTSVLFSFRTGPFDPGTLWITDGTEANTRQLLSTASLPVDGPGGFVTVTETITPPTGFGSATSKQVAYFTTAYDGIWRSDGTQAGTFQLAKARYDAERSLPVVFGSFSRQQTEYPYGTITAPRIVFAGDDGVAGTELWISDGTAAGTVLRADINPAVDKTSGAGVGSKPSGFVVAGSRLYFSADDGVSGRELWAYDGTSVFQVADVAPGAASSNPVPLGAVGTTLYFSADDGVTGRELWTTDGETTALLRDVRQGPAAAFVSRVDQGDRSTAVQGGGLLFAADDGQHGVELWTTDGTASGTTLVRDINVKTGDGVVATDGSGTFIGAAVIDGTVYFPATDGVHGTELWRRSGDAPPELVADITPGAASSALSQFTVSGGKLFFTVPAPFIASPDSVGGGTFTLWVSDGTPTGTFKVADDVRSRVGSSPTAEVTRYLAPCAGGVVFAAADAIHGTELWFSDGTAAGTRLLVDIADNGAVAGPNGDSSPEWFVPLGGKVYFVANDAGGDRQIGRTDGTVAGTVRVTDLPPGGSPSNLAVYGGGIVFAAADAGGDVELWKLAGGTAERIADINPNGSSNPAGFVEVGGLLYFTADDGVHGSEPWVTDGTAAGTRLLADVNPGSGGSAAGAGSNGFVPAKGVAQLGGGVVFSGYDGTQESLWPSAGTPESTKALPLPEGVGSGSPGNVVVADGRVYFTADVNGRRVLFESDGTVTGGRVVALSPGVVGTRAVALAATGDRLLFSVDDGVVGSELWQLPFDAPPPVDTTPPAVSIVASTTFLPFGVSAMTITFTLSEPCTGFTNADVQVAGGTLTGFTGSGTTYTATFTPDLYATSGYVSVGDAAFTDLAGNPNAAAGLYFVIDRYTFYDTVPPSVTTFATAAGLSLGQTATFTFFLSEECVGFSAAALVASSGTLTDFAGSGRVYTATYTPPADFAGVVSVAVQADSFTDLAGNPNTASLQHFIDVNTIVPTVAISTTIQPGPALIAGGTATLRFALSTPSATFDAGDVQVTGGVLSNFTGSGTSYTATFTPLADFTGIATVAVPAGGFTGLPQGQGFALAVGNANAAGALTPAMAVDTRAPTINVTASTTKLLVGQSATVTFRLSEPAASFTPAAIQAVNGTLSGFSGSGTTYTAVFTPQPGFLGTGTVGVAAGAFTDVAGNPLASPASVPFSIDTQPPVAIAATPIPSGFHRAGAVLAFDLVMNEPVTVTGTPRIPLVVGSTPRQAVYVGSPDGSRLRFAYTVQPGDNTPVGDRTGPRLAGAIDLAGGSIRDPIGNDMLPTLPAIGAADVVIDTTPPTVAVTSSRSLLGAGQTAVITFTLSEPSPDFGPGSVATTGGTLSGFTGSGLVFTALFTPQTNLTGSAVVKVDVGRFTDRAGNTDFLAAERATAVDTALRFAAGTDGQSVVWDREFAYRAATATTIRLPLPASQAAFFTPRTVLSITPNGSTQSIAANVKASRYDPASGAVVVTLDKPVPVTKTAGYGTLVLGGIVPPGARLLAGVSGAVVHEYGAAELLQAGYSPAFVTRFQGGLRTAAADLDDNGFADIIVAPGGVPNTPDPLAPGRRLADAFGSSLRTVAIFDGSPVPAWAPVKLDVGPVLGMATQGGFEVTAGNLVADATGSGTLELVVASGTKLAVYEVRIAAPGARPSIATVPIRVVDLGAGRTATGVTTGRLFADDPYDDVVVAATTATGRVAGTTTVSILAGGSLGVVRSFPVSSQVESGPSRRLTDIFGFGASVAAGDVDGDGSIDLVLGAGAGGLGNFRVLANEFFTADPRQPGFVATIAAQLGPGGRFAQYRAPAQSWRPTGGPDYFTPGPVTGPTGQGFNAPVSVRVVNVSTTGSARAEVFAALGAANQTANTVKRFLFTGPGGWTSAAAFDLLPSSAGDLRFRRGAGVRLG